MGVRGRHRVRFYSRRSRNRSLSLRNGCMLLAGCAGRRPGAKGTEPYVVGTMRKTHSIPVFLSLSWCELLQERKLLWIWSTPRPFVGATANWRRLDEGSYNTSDLPCHFPLNHAAVRTSGSRRLCERRHIQQQRCSRRRHRRRRNFRPKWHQALWPQRHPHLPAVRRIDRPSQRCQWFGQAARQIDRSLVLVVTCWTPWTEMHETTARSWSGYRSPAPAGQARARLCITAKRLWSQRRISRELLRYDGPLAIAS